MKKKAKATSFKIPMRFLIEINGELRFIFSENEMVKAAKDFRFALMMKFLKVHLSIEKI